MKYIFRKMIVLAVIASIVFLHTHLALAASEITPDAAYLIRRYNTSLTITANGTFVIDAQTQTYSVVDWVSVTVYLQAWDGSRWQDIKSWTSSRENDTMAYINVAIEGVPWGYYYRTRGVHKATLNYYTETLYSYSSSIYY
jgi:hypothetical protein